MNLAIEGYVVLSALDGETGLALARTAHPDLGADEYVVKPFSLRELLTHIQAALVPALRREAG